MAERMTTPDILDDEVEFERSIRPLRFDDFPGQEKVKERVKLAIEAATKRGEVLDHSLFHGPPGLGKTTLAHIIAKEMGTTVHTTSGPVLEKPKDLVGVLTNLGRGDVVFIDEIHRTPRVVEEYLYAAMEDFTLDIMIDQGPNARSIPVPLEHFTLIGATTRAGLLTPALRTRFGITERLDFYSPEDLALIARRSARVLGVEIHDGGAIELANRSRGTARVVNRLLRRVRDYAEVRANGVITQSVAHEALLMLDVDEKGLDEMDKRILLAIIEKFEGGPVGIENLAVVVGEERDTLEEVYEPYLIQEGYLKRTPRGREATRLSYLHFGIEPQSDRQLRML
jgi:Holliday junction DNA helicase RuvB